MCPSVPHLGYATDANVTPIFKKGTRSAPANYVIVITQARVLCLIYTHDSRGRAAPEGECVYTIYDKTFEGEHFRGFRGFGSTANFFPRIFPSKFFSNNIASSSNLFLVVQIMVYKEYPREYRNAEKEGSAG